MSDFTANGSGNPLLANAQNPEEPAPVASDFLLNGTGSPLLANAQNPEEPAPVASDFTANGTSSPLLANVQNPEEPAPVASDFTGNGNGSPLIADAVIDGGINGGVDEGSPERRTSRGLVSGNGGNGLAFSDGVVYSFGDLLPSGLISDSGDEAFFRGVRGGSVSNGTGNLVVTGSGTDPFAAPLTTLI
jgi:hypothetical protein